MKTAILRTPPPGLEHCELTHIGRTPIDPVLALNQHQNLARILADCNYSVITLPPVPGLPDSSFVEDTALILPEAAILLPLGTGSRSAEAELIRAPLQELFGSVRVIPPPVRIEGGDILRTGKQLFVGISTRTDVAGAEALADITDEWGYEVSTVEIGGSLHLKTAVTAPDDRTVLLNPEWVDPAAFGDRDVIEVDGSEPFAANILRLWNKIVAHKGFPRTTGRLRNAGFEVVETDISEFLKAEAGLTCLCLLT